MSYFVYLLECADKTIYTGITTDVARRFVEHKNKIGSHYTASHGARKIIYTEECASRSEALKREAEIKKWPRGKKVAFVKSKGSV
jgi:putative endonuclease